MFTSQDVAELIRATKVQPKRDRDDLGRWLADRLAEIAISFVHGRLWQQKPPPSKISRQLESINNATRKLLAVLQHRQGRHESRASQNDNVLTREVRYRLTAQAAVKVSTPELTDLASGSKRLDVAIGAVQEIADWSEAATKRESTKKGRKLGNTGDVAMQELIGETVSVWRDYWDRAPGASHAYSTGQVGGPYIRFVQSFLKCIEQHLTDEDLTADPGLRSALRASPEAIRERLQATGVAAFTRGGKSTRD